METAICHRAVNFNPRSRKGSDRHAFWCYEHLFGISIHAPARGATEPVCSGLICSADFNPRSRKGSDAKRNQRPYH